MSTITHNLRLHGALGLLVIVSMYHSVTRIKDSAARFVRRPKVDDVSRFEMRLKPVRKILSDSHYEMVGYLTDAPGTADWFAEYFQTQYSLAPVIVSDSSDSPVVVTNFHDLTLIDQLVRSKHPSLVVNCGNGVFLLKRPQ